MERVDEKTMMRGCSGNERKQDNRRVDNEHEDYGIH
jgi:hypothetical protein